MNETYEDPLDTIIVSKLIAKKKKNTEDIYNSLSLIDKLRTENKHIDDKLYKLCIHKWVRDECDYGPYSRPSYVCSICEITK